MAADVTSAAIDKKEGPDAIMNITSIVFDQGNTLILDPFRSILHQNKSLFQRICTDYGVSVDETDLIEQWILSNSTINYPHLGHFYQEEPIVQAMLQHLHVKDSVIALLGLEILSEYRKLYRKYIENNERCKEVKETILALKKRGKRLGVFSNDRSVSLGFFLDTLDIRQYFEYIRSSEELGIEKPDPAVFQDIINHFSTPPGDIVYVGDDYERDIKPAKEIGLQAIRCEIDRNQFDEPWRYTDNRETVQPDYTIKQFSELLDLIK